MYPEYIHYAGNKAMQYLTDLQHMGDGDSSGGMASGHHNPTLQRQRLPLRMS